MSTVISQHSAKILVFPRKSSLPSVPVRLSDRMELDARVACVEFGSGWYHEAAVQDAQRARKP